MKDEVDFVLGQDPVEELWVEDRADVVLANAGGKLGVERGKVEGDDRPVRGGGQGLDQAVADLAGGTGDQDDRFARHRKEDGVSGIGSGLFYVRRPIVRTPSFGSTLGFRSVGLRFGRHWHGRDDRHGWWGRLASASHPLPPRPATLARPPA